MMCSRTSSRVALSNSSSPLRTKIERFTPTHARSKLYSCINTKTCVFPCPADELSCSILWLCTATLRALWLCTATEHAIRANVVFLFFPPSVLFFLVAVHSRRHACNTCSSSMMPQNTYTHAQVMTSQTHGNNQRTLRLRPSKYTSPFGCSVLSTRCFSPLKNSSTPAGDGEGREIESRQDVLRTHVRRCFHHPSDPHARGTCAHITHKLPHTHLGR